MPTECSADLFGFERVEGRLVVAAFDGGTMISDAGGLLLGATDRAIGLIERFARCFSDSRAAELVEHKVATMVGQRVFGIALGYEDLLDHDELRHDPIRRCWPASSRHGAATVRRWPANRRSTGSNWAPKNRAPITRLAISREHKRAKTDRLDTARVEAPDACGAHLSQCRELPAAGAGACCRDA